MIKNQHLRWNSLRSEWVFYSPVRQERTFLPQASNCPLCPSQKDGMKTDIPVSDYEIAVFDNRFSALSFNPPEIASEVGQKLILHMVHVKLYLTHQTII